MSPFLIFNTCKAVILCLLMLCYAKVKAQTPAQIDQYLFNGLVLNPAYSGSREVLHGAVMVRQQWTGFGNAPFLGTVALDGVNKSRRNGFGILGSISRSGPLYQNKFDLTYAYRIPVKNGKLAFGLSAGISTLQLRAAEVATTDPGDVEFLENSPLLLAPEAGFGVWYENPRFYFGLSAPKLLGYYSDRYELYGGEAGRTPYYLATGGVLIPIGQHLKLKPTTLFRYIPEIDPQLDLNLFLIAKDLVWLGTGWRNNGDWIFLAEVQLNHQLHLGYAYGWSRPELRPWNNGSHSITLSYDFGYQVKTDRPRYYW